MGRKKSKFYQAGSTMLFSNSRSKRQRRGNRYLNTSAIKAFGMLFFAIGFIIILSPVVFANPFKHVHVVDGYGEYTILTKADTVEDIYKRGVLNIKQGDTLDNMQASLYDGSTISINRSIVVNVTSQGQTQRIRTKAGSTRDVLKAAGIEFDENDIFNYGLDEPLTNGANLVHSVVETKIITKRESIAYDTVTVNDPSLLKGKSDVVFAGENGYKNIEYLVTYKDGVEISRTVKGETVIKEPISRKVAIGTKPSGNVASSGSNSSSLKPSKPVINVDTPSDISQDRISSTRVMNVTAYTHTGRPTATGVMPRYGTVAVHPNVIPYGTKLYIPGYGIGVAQDTGSLAPNTIDVFFNTKNECISWGRKSLTIYILKY